jgi:hypothetical protein
MKPASRRIFSVVLVLMVLALVTVEARADSDQGEDDSLMVSIESADYLDFDGDGVEDDIIVEYEIEVPNGNWYFSRTDIYCVLELPSGDYFDCLIIVIGKYNSLKITMVWYNTAIESGWYTFSVYAFAYGYHAPEPGGDSYVFDPPTPKEPGTPVIDIIEVEAT